MLTFLLTFQTFFYNSLVLLQDYLSSGGSRILQRCKGGTHVAQVLKPHPVNYMHASANDDQRSACVQQVTYYPLSPLPSFSSINASKTY